MIEMYSEDGRLRIRLNIEEDGKFDIDLSALVTGTSVKAIVEQDRGAGNVTMRGKIEEKGS